MIYFILFMSIVLNGFLGWYAYNLLRDRINLIELFKKFAPVIIQYEENLTALTKMDMYFGDPTLMNLLTHTKEVSSTLQELVQSLEIEDGEPNAETEQ